MFSKKPERIRPVGCLNTRRAFLTGSTAIIGLPFLESLTPRIRSVQAQETSASPRLLVYYLPNGNIPNHGGMGWQPSSTGTDWGMTDTLSPLEAFRSKMLVLSRMNNSPAQPTGNGGHMTGTAGFLTCRQPAGDGVTNVGGPSMDQVYADHIAGQARIHSLALGTDTIWGNDPPWSTDYPRNISWANATTPAGRIVDPPAAFDRVFEGVDTGGGDEPAPTPPDPATTFDRALARVSVLDQVKNEAKSLSVRLNAGDRAKVEEYLEGLRRLEGEVQSLVGDETGGNVSTAQCTSFTRPTETHQQLRSRIDEMSRIMQEIMVHAFLCNSTRVITYMRGNGGWDEQMSQIGVNAGHHSTSHHGGSSSNLANLQRWDRYEMEMISSFIARLDEIDEGGGRTMLDNTLLYIGNEIGDGDRHDQQNKLTLLFGGAAGLAQGTHLDFGNQGQEHAAMYTAMLQGLGVDINGFGQNSLGPLMDIQG